MVEPELAYMPLKKKIEPISSASLHIHIQLYNTLNLETMEYSHTIGKVATGIHSHIVVFDEKGNLYFNSKQQNSIPDSYYILNNIPLGHYQIKVIYATDGGIVDNNLYDVDIIDYTAKHLFIYLKYHWITVSALTSNKCSHDIYTDCSQGCNFSNINTLTSWDRVEITDDETSKLIGIVPCVNSFQSLERIGWTSQLWGTFGGTVFVDGTGITGYSYDFMYSDQSGYTDASGRWDVRNSNHIGSISVKLLDNVYIRFDTCTKHNISGNRFPWNELYDSYDNYKSYNETNTENFGSNVVISENVKTYKNETLVDEQNVYENGYYTAYTLSTNTGTFTDAITYFLAYLHSTDVINEQFFGAKNYIIVQNKETDKITTYSSWEDYNNYVVNNDNIEIIKKCAKYDIDKFYFDPDINAQTISYCGLNNYRGHYFNIILPTDGTIKINNLSSLSSRYFTGYSKFNEHTSQQLTEHYVNTGLESYSDDYDKY